MTATYSPGLAGVVAGITAISHVDTERDLLTYRGYDIHDLVDNCSFDEVAYLLLYGELPSQTALDEFVQHVIDQRAVPDDIYALYATFPPGSHPMDTLKAALGVLILRDPSLNDTSVESNVARAVRLYAKIPNLVVNGYRVMNGQDPIRPNPGLSHSANFFHMLTGAEPNALFDRVFNVTQILYAEHGYNASTFAARVTVSTLSDLYSGVFSAIGALKGPLHGGANEAAMDMLQEIDSVENAKPWVRDALAQKRKIMGFGHREYKHGDERAKIVKTYALQLAEELGEPKWRDISQVVEEEMLAAKGLHPNLDFPVASAYYMMGIPIPLYTPIFVMSRITGWCAHIIEQLANNRLIRPSNDYDGPELRRVTPIGERG